MNDATDTFRVLVVDDNRAVHDDFKRILNPASARELDTIEALFLGEPKQPQVDVGTYEISSVYQGEDAVEQVAAAAQTGQFFDVAFVDLRMPPGLDGVETIERLWRIDSKLQVVLCTAYSDYTWIEIVEQLGQTDNFLILKKPFDSVEVNQMASALAMKRRRFEHPSASGGLNESPPPGSQKLESLGRRAAGVAHELSTPMQYIGDSVEFAQQQCAKVETLVNNYESMMRCVAACDPNLHDRLDAELPATSIKNLWNGIPAALSDAEAGVMDGTRIVNGIREYSHPASMRPEPSDLHECIECALKVTRGRWECVADVKIETATDLPPMMLIVSELKQALINLVVNAAQAVEERHGDKRKGQITIRTRCHQDFVEIDIEDDGVGIQSEILSRVCEPFFTTKAVGEGTGQGLAFVKLVVEELHDGQLFIETSEMGGAQLRIQLPLRRGDDSRQPMAPNTSHRNDAMSTGTGAVLVGGET